MTNLPILSPPLARRLAIAKQRLAGPLPKPDADGMIEVVRDLGCLQLDPIGVVARSHQLVLFSRLGAHDPTHLDQLLWQERRLFEYWAHCASIVLTEDYPLYSPLMRAYPWSGRTRAWVRQNEKLRRYVLQRVRRDGPLLSRHIEEDGLDPEAWVSTGWTSGRNISRMLDFLWIGGKIMVAGRDGIQKLWDLSERLLELLHGAGGLDLGSPNLLVVLLVGVDTPQVVLLAESQVADGQHPRQHRVILVVVPVQPVAADGLAVLQPVDELSHHAQPEKWGFSWRKEKRLPLICREASQLATISTTRKHASMTP